MPAREPSIRKPACGGEACTCEQCFCDRLDAGIDRKLRARRGRRGDAWYGIGLFGLVGWGVAVPTLAGVAVGVWLDRSHPGHASWALMGLGLGVLLGCLNALAWVGREQRAIHQPEPEERDAPDAR